MTYSYTFPYIIFFPEFVVCLPEDMVSPDHQNGCPAEICLVTAISPAARLLTGT